MSLKLSLDDALAIVAHGWRTDEEWAIYKEARERVAAHTRWIYAKRQLEDAVAVNDLLKGEKP